MLLRTLSPHHAGLAALVPKQSFLEYAEKAAVHEAEAVQMLQGRGHLSEGSQHRL